MKRFFYVIPQSEVDAKSSPLREQLHKMSLVSECWSSKKHLFHFRKMCTDSKVNKENLPMNDCIKTGKLSSITCTALYLFDT